MDDRILLDAGSGGRASQRLISQCFMRHFSNPLLDRMDDAALLDIKGPLAMSTDSYTVTPLFFAGGSIGTLAVHGTVNDVAMLGARPRYLSCACIIEEGLELSTLDRVVADMAAAAQTAGVHIVTGDTKVVPRGMCDRIFINTTGVGEIFASPVPSGHAARPGDAVLVSGALGDHGLTVMGSREGLSFLTDVASDSAPLNHMIADIITACGEVHVLRDPTRGGLATTLNEIAEQSASTSRKACCPCTRACATAAPSSVLIRSIWPMRASASASCPRTRPKPPCAPCRPAPTARKPPSSAAWPGTASPARCACVPASAASACWACSKAPSCRASVRQGILQERQAGCGGGKPFVDKRFSLPRAPSLPKNIVPVRVAGPRH